MKRVKSPVNNREYFYCEPSDTGALPTQLEGLPVFSLKEITLMRGRAFTCTELNALFDAKVELGATVESVTAQPSVQNDLFDSTAKPSPLEEIGYKAIYESQEAIAKRHAANIRAMLRGKGARTDEEKKIALIPEVVK